MCGIVGEIAFGKIKESDITIIKQMADAIKHRGPDSDGYCYDENIAFGHRRLSILDISSNANQPMISNDGNLVIVFNGEIYNFQEIRKKLESKYKFKTDHSDTETILYAYKEWGIECIHKFNGFFAFAIYDRLKQEVFLVRDRLGKKPLYFIQKENNILFSSEIHAFFKADVIKKELNEEAIYHYLTFLTVNTPQTFFKNVFKLEAGHYLKISPNNIEKIKYWDIADFINKEAKDDFQTAVITTEEKLAQSMFYRNIADVDISVALSGGLDSSLNLYYSNMLNKNIKAINIAYEKTSKYDESVVAKKFADECKVDFIGQNVTDKYFEDLINEFIKIQLDSPMGDINSILVYLLSKISILNGCKVMLVGEGGDEIGGYPIYQIIQNEYRILKKLNKINSLFNYLPEKIANKLSVFYNSQVISRRHIHGFTEYEKNNFWLGTKFNSYQILAKYMDEVRDDLRDSFLRKILNIEYKLRLPELILTRIDYPSMATSVEARSPFMDHELIGYSAGLSFDIKMRSGAKSILKEISKNKLPDYTLNHPKVGFGMLLTPFLQNTMPIWFRNELIEKTNELHNFISKEYLDKLLQKHNIDKNQGYKMWILYALSKWLKGNFDA